MIHCEAPIVVEQAYYRTDMCEAAFEAHQATATRLDARTLTKTVYSIESYADLKF